MAQQDIIDELNYLKETKQQIKQAIIGKGQTIATDTPFREYATKINNISEVEKNYMTLDPELRNTLKSTYNSSNWYIDDYSISINTTTFKITITNLISSETYQVDMPEIDFTNKSGGFYVFKANNANEYNIYFAYMGPTGEISEYNQPIRVNKYVLNVYMQQCVTKFTDKLIGNFYYNHASLKLLQLGKTDNLILMISTRAGWSPYPTTFYWYRSDNDNVTTFTYGSDITSNQWVSLNEKCFYASNAYSGYIFIEKDGSWQPMTCGFFIYGVNNLNNKIIGQYPKSAGNETTIYTANIELNSSGSYVVSPKQVLIPNGTWGATDWYHFNGGYAHWLDDYNAILMINIGNNTSPSSIRLTTVDTLNQTFDSDTLTLSTKQLTQTDKMDTSKFYATVNNTNYVYQVSAEGIEVEVGLEYENKEYYLPDNLELGTSADLLSGKSAILNNGLVRGTMPNNGALTYTPTTSQQTIPAGYTSGGTVGAVTSAIDSNIQASNIKAGVTILGVQGNVEPDKPDQTKSCTPTTSQQVIEPDTGYELASVTVNAVTSSIDNNIQPENIKSGVEILGVTGTYSSGGTDTSDANATSGDILENKTAYVNGQKLTGTLGTNVTSTFNDTNAELYTKIQNTYDNMTPLVASDSDKRAGLGIGIITIPSKSNGTPLLDTSNVTDMHSMFSGCSDLISIPLLDTSNVVVMEYMFADCFDLISIPLLDTSKVVLMTSMFSGCISLSNTSLDNILAMCTNAVSYISDRTLVDIGLTQTQAQICTTLSNYQDFVNAGWTTGY